MVWGRILGPSPSEEQSVLPEPPKIGSTDPAGDTAATLAWAERVGWVHMGL